MISQLIEKQQVLTTRSMGYRKSIQFHTDPNNGNAFFIPHLVNETNDLMASFARVATSSELTMARTENDDAKILAIFQPARDFCNQKLVTLFQTLDAANFTRFTARPMYFGYLSPTRSLADSPAQNSAGTNNQHTNDSGTSPPRKKGKHDMGNNSNSNTPINNNSRNNNGSPSNGNNSRGNNSRGSSNATPTTGSFSSFGIIKPVNKPATWRPKIPANITGRSNGDPATKKICPSFILSGASCAHHPSCNLLHLTNRNFQSVLDPTSQSNFIEWVNTSTDVEWSSPNGAPQRNG